MSHPTMLRVNGKKLSVSEWARRLGVAPSVIHSRLLLGWPATKAVSVPARKRTDRFAMPPKSDRFEVIERVENLSERTPSTRWRVRCRACGETCVMWRKSVLTAKTCGCDLTRDEHGRWAGRAESAVVDGGEREGVAS